jgi:hypothetical protein
MTQAVESTTTDNIVFLSTAGRRPVIPQRHESPLQAAHSNLIAAIAGFKPHHVIGDCDVQDVEERADHVRSILKVVAAYVMEIASDTSDRMPFGAIFVAGVKSILDDSIGDIVGGIQHGAITMEMTQEHYR